MPWSWAVCAELQLYLLIPLWVYIYSKSKKAIVVLSICMIIIGMTIVGVMAGIGCFTAGIYTLENYELYRMMLIKPYAKIHLHGLGILCAIFYFDILEYRKIDDKFDKAKAFPKIHYLSNNIKLAKLLMLMGVTLVLTNFFVTYEPGLDAYSWS